MSTSVKTNTSIVRALLFDAYNGKLLTSFHLMPAAQKPNDSKKKALLLEAVQHLEDAKTEILDDRDTFTVYFPEGCRIAKCEFFTAAKIGGSSQLVQFLLVS